MHSSYAAANAGSGVTRNVSRTRLRTLEAQQPQQAETPSRSRSSRIETQPSATVSRISCSVTALQIQTYICHSLAGRAGACARRRSGFPMRMIIIYIGSGVKCFQLQRDVQQMLNLS